MANKPMLVYTVDCRCPEKSAGDPVEVGDVVMDLHNDKPGARHIITFFREPQSINSQGKVSYRTIGAQGDREVYCSVIGARWFNRND